MKPHLFVVMLLSAGCSRMLDDDPRPPINKSVTRAPYGGGTLKAEAARVFGPVEIARIIDIDRGVTCWIARDNGWGAVSISCLPDKGISGACASPGQGERGVESAGGGALMRLR